MKSNLLHTIFTLVLAVMILSSCQQAGVNSTGSEYIPDMAHSLAYEANHYNYYSHNTWGTEEEYYEYAKPRSPVEGTVPRTRGDVAHGGINVPVQGSTPYYYSDTEEDRARAIAELIDSPYPISEAGLAEGKEMYDIFCGICHGEKGDGNGYLVRDDGGVYPVQPANFLMDEHISASNGRYYHAIVYGKNLMGGYTDKISTEERWQVIHYIRSLQAKEKNLAYNEYENTLNSVDRPAGDETVIEAVHEQEGSHEASSTDEEHDNSHSGH